MSRPAVSPSACLFRPDMPHLRLPGPGPRQVVRGELRKERAVGATASNQFCVVTHMVAISFTADKNS